MEIKGIGFRGITRSTIKITKMVNLHWQSEESARTCPIEIVFSIILHGCIWRIRRNNFYLNTISECSKELESNKGSESKLYFCKSRINGRGKLKQCIYGGKNIR